MKIHCYITFPTVFFALRAESVLAENLCPFKMVPVPRSISSSCGTALQCSCEDVEKITELLNQGHVEFDSIHRLT